MRRRECGNTGWKDEERTEVKEVEEVKEVQER